MSDDSFDAAQRALRNRAIVDLEEPFPDEQPTRWWLRILVVLVFFVFGAIVWLSWRDNAGDGSPVLVSAPPGPIKEKPADEGGISSRDDNTRIAEVLAGKSTGTGSHETSDVGPKTPDTPPVRPPVEVIPPAGETGTVPLSTITPSSGPVAQTPTVPPGELPNTTPVTTRPTPSDTSRATTSANPAGITVRQVPPINDKPINTVMPSAPEPIDQPPVIEAQTAGTEDGPTRVVPPVAPVAPVAPAAPEVGTAAVSDPSEADLEPVPVEDVDSEEAEPEVAALPTPPPSPPQQASTGFRIQVGSLRSEDAANIAWTRVQQKNKDVIGGGIQRSIVQAEVKGLSYYRVQAHGFPSLAAAQAACAKIKSRGSDCLVVGR